MRLEGGTDRFVTITEEEYELLLMYKLQFENLLLKNKNAPSVEGCERALSN